MYSTNIYIYIHFPYLCSNIELIRLFPMYFIIYIYIYIYQKIKKFWDQHVHTQLCLHILKKSIFLWKLFTKLDSGLLDFASSPALLLQAIRKFSANIAQ